jgi:hypothetical protein
MYWEQLGPSTGVIYSWLYMFKYTQHTADFTENNWDPALELSTLDYMFKYTQHTADFTENKSAVCCVYLNMYSQE